LFTLLGYFDVLELLQEKSDKHVTSYPGV